MAKLDWGIMDQRFYEAGADRGVLYPATGHGVPWTGLVSVDERSAGGGPQAYYVDGLKYANLVEATEFEATLTALSAPSEFAACDGSLSLGYGLFATEQPRKSFGLSYRTLIGDAGQGLDRGYKLHLIYNALAAPTGRTNSTLSDSPEVVNLSWEISTRPDQASGFKPTAHLVVDSTKSDPMLLALLEALLYGHEGLAPRLPSVKDLVTLFSSWSPFALGVPPKFLGAAPEARTSVTNLATNPSFEAANGTVEVRRNLAHDPRATVSGGIPSGQARWLPRWFGSGGAGTTTLVTGATDGPEVAPGVRVPTYMRKTWSVAGSIGDTGFDHTTSGTTSTPANASGLPVVAGRTYTFSSWVRASRRPGTANVDLRVVWRDAAGERILPAPTRVLSAITPGVWQRVSITLTAPANAATASIATDIEGGGATWQPGDTLDGTALLIEESPVLGPYFDGSTSPDPDLTPSWTGTANASASILTGAGVAMVPNAGAAGVAVSSAQWAKSGSRSLRLVRRAAGDAFQQVTLSLVPGLKYTAILSSRVSNALPIAGAVIVQENGGGYRNAGALVPNGTTLSGEQEWRVTFTLPADWHAQTRITFRTGGAVGDSVWWDNFALVEGDYIGPYFDGSSRDLAYRKQSTNGTWVGAPNASASKLWFSGSLPQTASEGDVFVLLKDATINQSSLYVFKDNLWVHHRWLPFDI